MIPLNEKVKAKQLVKRLGAYWSVLKGARAKHIAFIIVDEIMMAVPPENIPYWENVRQELTEIK